MRRKFPSPPMGADEYQTFAMGVLHYTLLILIGLVLLATFFLTSAVQWVFIPVFLSLLVSCLILLHHGRYPLASALFLGGVWFIITLAAFSLNGIRNSSISTYAVVIIFSAILFTERATLFFAIISILSCVVLVVGELVGVLPLRRTELFIADRFFQYVALFISSGILLTLSSRLIQRVYGQAQERNRALESEIAERQRAETTLKASEENYRLLFENNGALAAVYDEEGTIILANSAMANFFGKTPQELIGMNLRDILPPSYSANAIEQHRQAIGSGQTIATEGEFFSPAWGRVVHFLRYVTPLPPTAHNDAKRRVQVITTDISARKQAEQRERELSMAEEKNAFLTDFLSTISHDLKTPLSVLNTSLYLLERAEGNAAYRQQKIAQMKEQLGLLDKYIQDMLTIARLEHLPHIHQGAVDVHALIEDALALLRPRVETKSVHCQCALEAEEALIWGDREQLSRVLVNLLENAINYTPFGGHITVQTRLEGEAMAVEVTDDGIGIHPEDLPHIFQRFYRAESARRMLASGTGLGLAIVQKIIAIHNGVISVTSAPDEGTTFSIRLPLKRG